MADPIIAAGYAPCPMVTAAGPCPGRAYPVTAAEVGPGLVLAGYGPAGCGHTIPAVFLLDLAAAGLDLDADGDLGEGGP